MGTEPAGFCCLGAEALENTGEYQAEVASGTQTHRMGYQGGAGVSYVEQ